MLSQIYTQTLGDWALWLFYLGVVVTLYGTIFASTAAHSRMMADSRPRAGVYPREDAERRLQWRNRFVVVLAVLSRSCSTGSSSRRCGWSSPAASRRPAMLPLIGFAAIYMRHTQLPPRSAAGAGDDRHAVAVDRGDARLRALLRRGASGRAVENHRDTETQSGKRRTRTRVAAAQARRRAR